MTISATIPTRHNYSGNGVATSFSYTVKISSTSHLKLVHTDDDAVETVLVLDTDYTVNGAGDAGGGTVDFPKGGSSYSTLATGEKLAIIYAFPIEQTTDLPDTGRIFNESVEDQLDYMTVLDNQHEEKFDRAVLLTEGSTMTGLTMPEGANAAARKNKAIVWNTDGDDLTIATSIGQYQGNWATATAYLERDTVKDTSNSNIYYCNTAHTSSGSQPISSNTDVAKWDLIVDAAAAGTSATAAATSATAAAASETAAETAETNAETAETNAETAETAAQTAQTAAETAETNAETAESNAEASAGALAWKYTFDSSTSMADPGAGDVRFDNATVASVTNLAIDATSADTGSPDISDLIASIDDGTNTSHEGFVTIRKSGTPATFAVFSVTGTVVDNTGWLQIPVTHVASNGAISDTNTLYISLTRSGNIGATGSTGATGPTGPTGPAGEGSDTPADNVFRITDQTDTTKRIAFEASGVSTSTTRTVTMPDKNLTLIDEGTELKSTGEAGGTKFLREDGDNSCSWQTITSGGPSLGTDSVIRTNAKTISENITFAGDENGSTVGPVSVANTYTVVVSNGSTWTII